MVSHSQPMSARNSTPAPGFVVARNTYLESRKKTAIAPIAPHLMASVNAILAKVQSGKIRDVTEGLNELRNAFSSKQVINRFCQQEDSDGNLVENRMVWLAVFQALFEAAKFGLQVYEKKSKTGTKSLNAKVLEQVASTIRWLVERTITKINSKISKALFNHLLQRMVYKEGLLQPVALDYIKTLKVVVSCRPHMERVTAKTWLEILDTGFNCVLGDPVLTSLDPETSFLDGIKELQDRLGGSVDDAMYEDDDDEVLPATPSTRKRRRRNSNEAMPTRATPAPFLTPQTLRRTGSIQAKPEQLEFASVIAIVLQHPVIPLPSSVLVRLARFLIVYPGDTSMNDDFLSALSATLSHLALNKIKDVEDFAKTVWYQLLRLWTSKNKRIKEVLVGILRVLFPYVILDDEEQSLGELGFDSAHGIGKLHEVLKAEVENRSGVEPLSLDTLRLEVGVPYADAKQDQDDGHSVLVAKTFRSGRDFDAPHALSWAVLELQADCAAKLFMLSESMSIAPATPSRPSISKRKKREDPISELLSSITTPTHPTARIYHLQILLFFIDRHWSILHDTIRREVFRCLMQGLSVDDGPIQSWTLLCLASLADNELSCNDTKTKRVDSSASMSGPSNEDSYDWDSLWTHSIRRANLPTVCRAACHTAYTLLRHWDTRSSVPETIATVTAAAGRVGNDSAKRFLSTHKVLIEIETLAKDLDVQGPSYPYDSVCALLSQSLRVASQDVRLFRMQLEDKVLNWLMDSWRGIGHEQQHAQAYGYGHGRDKMASGRGSSNALLDVGSVLGLLEYVCGFGKRNHIVARRVLPDCHIVNAMKQENLTGVIRDFVLSAKLTPFNARGGSAMDTQGPMRVAGMTASIGSGESTTLDTPTSDRPVEALPPRGRERRISAFLVKSTESLMSHCEALKQADTLPTAESARAYLDMAIIGLSFEALLEINGFQTTRRVVQNASKLIEIVTSWLLRPRWTLHEKCLVLHGLDPLTVISEGSDDEPGREVLLKPESGMGIRLGVFRRLVDTRGSKACVVSEAWRIEFLKAIWQNKDTLEEFQTVAKTLHGLSLELLGLEESADKMVIDIDRDSPSSQKPPSSILLLEMCIAFLAVGPSMGSSSKSVASGASIATLNSTPTGSMQSYPYHTQSIEPRRNKQLNSVVDQCIQGEDVPTFLHLYPLFLKQVRQQTVKIVPSLASQVLEWAVYFLKAFDYSRHQALYDVLVDALEATMGSWIFNSYPEAKGAGADPTRDLHNKMVEWAREFIELLPSLLRKGVLTSWKLRVKVAGFFDRLLSISADIAASDEAGGPGTWVDMGLLRKTLMDMGSDEDIRVRFRAALINAKVLGSHSGTPIDELYATMLSQQGRKAEGDESKVEANLDDAEYMISRIVSLGNVMVVSSAVRRAAYWKLLEICMHTNQYSNHVYAVLTAVAERMGLSSLSTLSECYGTQLAWSIQLSRKMFPEIDFTRFTPSLLGYPDRTSCAMALFSSFTPVNLLFQNGRASFEAHCKLLQKGTKDGILECFGDIVGYSAVIAFQDVDNARSAAEELLGMVLERTRLSAGSFSTLIMERSDAVSVAILRALRDQDVSSDGPIVDSLQPLPGSVAVWKAVTYYRKHDKFRTHPPHLPAFPATAVLRGLEWLNARCSNWNDNSTSYHVMHELFAAIHRSPLVNEQLRLINGLSLWIALHYENFTNDTLVYTLVHGATSLLSQVDLVRCAQSLLEWGFSCYSKLQSKDARLPDILIQICSIIHDYRASPCDHQLGKELESWIDEQTCLLSKSKYMRSEIASALLAWPHPPSANLMKLTTPTDSASSFLTTQRIVSNKFRLVRRLKEDVMLGGYDAEQWAKSDFWRLKDCMPGMEQMQTEDAHAFATLMILNRGFIDTNGQDVSPTFTQTRARHGARGGFKQGEPTSPRDCTILALLNILDENDPVRAYAAYQTLRMIMSVPASPVETPTHWESAHREELGLLEQLPRIPRPQVQRNLHDLANEKFLQAARNFKQWIALVTSLLSEVLSLNDLFYAQLTPTLGSDEAFAEEIFPVLIQTLLQSVESDDNALYIMQTLLSDYFAKVLSFEHADVLCLRSIIDAILHLRTCERTCKRNQDTPDPLGHDKWLSIDYNLLAQSAILYGAYTTALLFLELAAEYSSSQPGAPAVESILYEIYSHIDEPDGFYGIKTQDLHNFLLKRFHHEKQWDKAFRFHGAGLEAGNNQAREATGLLQAFHSFGFDHLAMENLQTSFSVSIQSSGMSYRLGWRTETWDLPDTSEDSNGAALYLALRAIYRERDSRKVDQATHASFLRSMHRLRLLGTENLAEIREVAQDIMCLSQVSQFRDPQFQESIAQNEPNIKMWTSLINIDSEFEFSALENIMATRISLVRSLQQREKRQQIGNMATALGKVLTDVEKQCLLKLSVAARHAGQVQIALNSVIRARGLEVEPSLDVAQEFASVLWLQKEEKLAVQHLKDLLGKVGNMKGSVDAIQEAVLYTRLGAWTSQACLEKPTDIWTNYFKRAVGKLKDQGSKDLQEQASVYHECAKFAEHQYHAISNSPDVIRWKLYAERKKNEIQERGQLIRSINDRHKTSYLSKDQEKAQKLLQEDTDSFAKHTAARDEFLREAINMYSRALAASDCFDDDSPLRLCSLWFANFDDAKLQDRIGVALNCIASRKLIFLAHQLSARLSKPSQGELSKQQAHLHRMIVRMCKEHPFHSLYQVFSIRAETTGERQSNRLAAASAAHKDRHAAAEDVFERLRNDPQSREILTHVEALCKACVEWAKHPIRDKKLYSGNVPDSLKIRKILNLKVPVITYHTPIDPTMRYDNCVWIKNYQTTYRTAGGVNLPKISVCVGSDGGKYTQLFKGEGNDDMRQDAVMEQVFELVNRVLRKDRETKRRELKVRDYKVIPLGTQVGLLEFVGNTLPLQKWLPRAHKRYRPQDPQYLEVRDRFKKNQAEYHNREDLARSFIKLKENFKPVMRHYFTEKHKNPIAWFTMRLNYTRSVATTSIVGYMIGLGDRHISNILLDEVSGEVVHIDLGIAFDQGKLLPVPELVPFRMTADMVDGMGTSGTQGVFQRCAEETLRVLREGSEVIRTVLEVFKYDPLHSWTASELKVKRIQKTTSNESIQSDVSRFGFGAAIGIDMSSGTAEEAADRALSGVARKLDKALSVEYTVNELISEATDPMNLACIYYGWSAIC